MTSLVGQSGVDQPLAQRGRFVFAERLVTKLGGCCSDGSLDGPLTIQQRQERVFGQPHTVELAVGFVFDNVGRAVPRMAQRKA